MARRDRQRDQQTGLPWARPDGRPANDQPTLPKGGNWTDRLVPLQGMPNFWGSTLRGDGIAPRRRRRAPSPYLFPSCWAGLAALVLVIGWRWAAVAFAGIAAFGFLRTVWRWIPMWSWIVVGLILWFAVVPLDFSHH